jgi:hypothetical protein
MTSGIFDLQFLSIYMFDANKYSIKLIHYGDIGESDNARAGHRRSLK